MSGDDLTSSSHTLFWKFNPCISWAKKKKNGAMTWLTLLGKRFSARITSGSTTLFQSSSRGIGVWIVSASVAHNLDLIFLKIV